MKEYIITPIEDKEGLHPNMLKCINCGEPAVFHVNGNRVCFDKVCFNRYTGAFSELFLRKEIDEARYRVTELKAECRIVKIQDYRYYRGERGDKKLEEVEKELEIAEKRLNELQEERTKRYREYLGEE